MATTLNYADLSEAMISSGNFETASLYAAIMDGTDPGRQWDDGWVIKSSTFHQANFGPAILSHVELDHIDFSYTEIDGGKWVYVKFSPYNSFRYAKITGRAIEHTVFDHNEN